MLIGFVGLILGLVIGFTVGWGLCLAAVHQPAKIEVGNAGDQAAEFSHSPSRSLQA